MSKPLNFALIGASGYIAPRHMKAIRDTGHRLTAVLDPYDGIGVIDSFFPEADYFSESERFDRHLDKVRRAGESKIDYVSICSPNYLHDAHIRMAMRNQADVICEKPLVLNPWNIDALAEIENETGKKINNILQLRLHDSIRKLKEDIEQKKDEFFDVDLTYITSRGHWYQHSWKGDVSKSGGVATNIGIHFFDMLTWIFGDVEQSVVHLHNNQKAAGYFKLKNANVRWFLSIDENDLPEEVKGQKRTFRSIRVNGSEFEFSEGFTELHTDSYRHILAGNGFGLEDARRSIEMVYNIRNSAIAPLSGEYHPILNTINK
ncbi:MAG: oxidoreductase [Bacteroidetes bacterium GWF2_43_63]|nr:MAG: oxidoreductase [Bacteroidetes bacterium GWE2_42_42]OFY54637.1 MAG: oxidoreductase [Bacteroidetes bacterium GWF2_43_63]HBG71856.1 oxidoreductase [Bacteroidales bacterium]HCB61439.1 oxidoreductase [Bacteroidales bacterium]HCY23326.1 oxidoreductase [Bacteroidales bacterium]